MTNKCTIISQIITLLHVSTLSPHPQRYRNEYLASYTNISKAAFGNKIYIKMFHNVNFITKSFIRKAFITWECIDYKLPQVGTTVSKHVGV